MKRGGMEFALSHLVEALPGLVWTALPDGRAEFLNRRWCEYTGLSLEQAVGFGWQSALHPEDVDLVLEYWRSALESGQPGEVEARLRRYDGEYRRFLFSTAPLADKSGRVVKWCGTNTDIEERLKAQEAFRDKHQLSIPLISDEQHEMLDSYGVWGEKSMYGRTFQGILRTTVLIGADGRIIKIWRNVKVDGHADEVLAAADAA